MSFTGNWGDKVIITLKSDGKRRHKYWCEHYRAEDGSCSKHCSKCVGSAFCSMYTDSIKEQEPIWFPKCETIDVGVVPSKKTKAIFKQQFYRKPSRDEKLLGKIVMVRNTPFTFRIGTAIEDDFYYISVEYGGQIHKYEKKILFRNNGIYVYTVEKFVTEVEASMEECCDEA